MPGLFSTQDGTLSVGALPGFCLLIVLRRNIDSRNGAFLSVFLKKIGAFF